MEGFEKRLTREQEQEIIEESHRLLDIRLRHRERTTPFWMTTNHREDYRCALCNEPLGFQEADGIGDKIYHQFCSAKLSRKG